MVYYSYKINAIGLPNLPYVHNEPFTATFTHEDGGYWTNDDYGFEISANKGVVAEGELVLLIGMCAWGNFAIPDKYQVITGFLCISASRKIDEPVKVTMDHCLMMPKYQTSESVFILKASHNKQYGGRYTFSANTIGKSEFSIHPCILENEPKLWFQLEQEFCILCVAYRDAQASATNPTNQDNLPMPQPSKPLPPSPHSSPTHGANPTIAVETKPQAPPEISQSSDLLGKPRHQKRKHSPVHRLDQVSKRQCQLELTVMMVEPRSIGPNTSMYTASIYVFQACKIGTLVGHRG